MNEKIKFFLLSVVLCCVVDYNVYLVATNSKPMWGSHFDTNQTFILYHQFMWTPFIYIFLFVYRCSSTLIYCLLVHANAILTPQPKKIEISSLGFTIFLNFYHKLYYSISISNYWAKELQ